MGSEAHAELRLVEELEAWMTVLEVGFVAVALAAADDDDAERALDVEELGDGGVAPVMVLRDEIGGMPAERTPFDGLPAGEPTFEVLRTNGILIDRDHHFFLPRTSAKRRSEASRSVMRPAAMTARSDVPRASRLAPFSFSRSPSSCEMRSRSRFSSSEASL